MTEQEAMEEALMQGDAMLEGVYSMLYDLSLKLLQLHVGTPFSTHTI